MLGEWVAGFDPRTMGARIWFVRSSEHRQECLYHWRRDTIWRLWRCEMRQTAFIFAGVILMAGAGFGIGYAHGGPGPGANLALAQSAAGSGPDTDTPAYHSAPPSGALPETLDPKQFPDVRTQKIYALAAKVKPVLYQQPCYCRCDREVGHTSLLDCFRDNHGSICDVCKKEAVYSYQQTKLGKSPAEIRAGIMAGKWKQVDLAKVDSAPAPVGGKQFNFAF